MARKGVCRHFNGIQHDTCGAGISYKSFNGEVRGWALMLPCMVEHKSEKTCMLYEEPTGEEIKEHSRLVKEAVAGFLRAYEAGRCPHCNALIKRERQVVRCVYAEPCGCRLWQGRARSQSELKKLHEETGDEPGPCNEA